MCIIIWWLSCIITISCDLNLRNQGQIINFWDIFVPCLNFFTFWHGLIKFGIKVYCHQMVCHVSPRLTCDLDLKVMYYLFSWGGIFVSRLILFIFCLWNLAWRCIATWCCVVYHQDLHVTLTSRSYRGMTVHGHWMICCLSPRPSCELDLYISHVIITCDLDVK